MIAWEHDIEVAQARAQDERKYVLVDFSKER